MAQVLYINADPDSQDRATELGCGWMPDVPAQFANIAEAPCVILNGCGRQVVLADDGTLTPDAVMTALQPLLDEEEQVSADTGTVQTVTVDPQALSDAQAAIAKATTVAGLRSATLAALNLLNPGT